jgi:hypothetical protein
MVFMERAQVNNHSELQTTYLPKSTALSTLSSDLKISMKNEEKARSFPS